MFIYIITMPRNGKTSKTFAKKVKEIVHDELQEELEEKHGLIGESNTRITTASIPFGNVGGFTNFIRIFPGITQGDGQYNERVGNEIRLKKIDITMLLQYASGEDFPVPVDYQDASLGVRVMLLRQRDFSAVAGAEQNLQGNKLLESGPAGGPGSYQALTFNNLQKINREQFAVRYDKVHYIDRNVGYNETGGQLAFSRPPRPQVMKHTLTFGKQGLKLTFGDAVSTDPTNFPYFLLVGYASTIDNIAPNDGIVQYSYSCNSQYTDA